MAIRENACDDDGGGGGNFARACIADDGLGVDAGVDFFVVQFLFHGGDHSYLILIMVMRVVTFVFVVVLQKVLRLFVEVAATL